MNFHRVRIENLNSLYGEQEVDFEDDVRNAPIFLIQGPTGAGKSTILDAICLALFGQTPRLVRRTGRADTDVAHIMSIGTARAQAEVEFSVSNPEGGRDRFLAVWSCRRAYDDPEGAVQRPERSLYRVFDDQTMRLIVSDHREKYFQDAFDAALRGLSVDDFKRSILLAQGEFSAFLNASDGEKASILERLTSTEHYRRIGERAARRRRKVEERHAAVHAKLEEMQLLSAEQERQLEQNIDDTRVALDDKRRERDVARDLARWLTTDAALQKALDERRQTRVGAETKLQERAGDVERLERDARLRGAEPAFREVERLEVTKAKLHALAEELAPEIERLQTRSAELQAAESAARTVVQEAEEARKAAEPEIRRAQDARAKLAAASTEAAAAQAKLEATQAALDQANKRIEGAEEAAVAAMARVERARERLDELRTIEPLRDELASLRASYDSGIAPLAQKLRARNDEVAELRGRIAAIDDELQTHADDIAEATRQRSTRQGALTRAKNRLDALLQDFDDRGAATDELNRTERSASERVAALKEGAYLLNRMTEREKERDELYEAMKRVDKEVEGLRAEEERLKEMEALRLTIVSQCQESLHQNEQVLALSALRMRLHTGEECPLCGSPVHPYCDSDELHEVDERAARDRERLEESLADAREQLRETNEAVQRVAAKYASRRTVFHQHESRVVSLRMALEEDQGAFARAMEGAGYAPMEVFRLRNAERIALELADAEAAVEQTRETLDEIDRARSAVESAEAKYEQAAEAFDVLDSQLAGLREERERLASRIETRQADHDSLQTELDAACAALFEALARGGVEASDAAGLPAALARAEAARTALVGVEGELERAQELARTAADTVDRERERRAAVEVTVQDARGALDDRAAAVKALSDELAGLLGGVDPDVVARRLAETTDEARKALEHAAKQTADITRTLTTQTTRLEENQRAAAATASELAAAMRTFDDTLAELKLERAELEQNLLPEEERTRLSGEITALDRALARETTRVEEAAKSLEQHRGEDSPVTELTIEEAEARAQLLETELNAVAEALGALRERMDKQRANIERRNELQAAASEIERELDVWNTIYQLVGVRDGERFKLFAQSLNLQGLVDKANHRLEHLHPRYRLAVAVGEGGEPTLAFTVEDRYQANTERPLTTLSGGETFLVSLALALGLADYRRVEMPIETLLLDEGFGTLDQDSLHMALNTLHQLHQDGSRQIGIISHVDALKELIDARIVVEKVGHGRSKIRFEFGSASGLASL